MTKKRTLAAPRAVDPVRKVPKRLTAPTLASGQGTARQIADSALKRLASKLKIDPQLADLRYEKVRETVLGRHVTYQQYHAGKPVSGAWIRVDIDKNGHVYNITNLGLNIRSDMLCDVSWMKHCGSSPSNACEHDETH